MQNEERSEGGLSALAKTHGKRFCNDVQSTKRSTKSLIQLQRTSTILCAYLRFLVWKVSSMSKQFFCIRYGFFSQQAQTFQNRPKNCRWVVKYLTFIIPSSILWYRIACGLSRLIIDAIYDRRMLGHSVLKISRYIWRQPYDCRWRLCSIFQIHHHHQVKTFIVMLVGHAWMLEQFFSLLLLVLH